MLLRNTLTSQNGVDDLDEIFTQGQENRLRIISSLHRKGLPTDVSQRRKGICIITNNIGS